MIFTYIMRKCHISIMCNELPFMKQKLQFLFDNFDQIIFVDYDMTNKCNSSDGTIEFVENFKNNYDKNNKIILIKDFNPNTIKNFHGESFVDKQKMFAKASEYVSNNIDIIWATDMDEFFHKDLLQTVDNCFYQDTTLQSIDIPHRIFVYNEY